MGMQDKANDMKDKAMRKAKEAMGKDENVDKMADKAKGMSGDKHDEQIDEAAQKAKEMNDNM
jgi:hypothetical protein